MGNKLYVVMYLCSNGADCQAYWGFTGAVPKGIFLSVEEARIFVQQNWPEAAQSSRDEDLWVMNDGDEIHICESQLHKK